MKRLLKLLLAPRAVRPLFWSTLVTALIGVAPPVALAADDSAEIKPDVVVLNLTSDVLDSIRKDKAIQAGDFEHVEKLVDERILPHVDFDKMTRLAVGYQWRGATSEQRNALIQQFRLLLLRTYSGALSSVTDEQVRLRPSHDRNSAADVIVRTEIVSSQGEPIELGFRLEKIDTDWKIYDLDIMGVWLVENYRGEFAAILNRGGIDVLIQALAEKNQRLAGANKKS